MRREFLGVLGGAAAAWPLAVRAQQSAIRRIGVLMGFAESDHGAQSGLAGFREELRKLGWMEGRNIEIDTRWATADEYYLHPFKVAAASIGVEAVVDPFTTVPSWNLLLAHRHASRIVA